MSIKLMSRVWELDLDHSEQAVALALADWADDDGTRIFPSMAHLGWKTGYSRRQVQRIVHALEKKGLVIKMANASRHRPTEYRMDVTAVRAKPPFRADNLSPLPTPPGVTSTSLGVTSATPRGDIAVSPEPPVGNHQSEPSKPLAASPRKRDPIWDTLVEIFGQPPATNGLRGAWNAAVAELKAQDATPLGMLSMTRRYAGTKQAWRVASPMAMAKWYGRPDMEGEGPATRTRALAEQMRREGR